MGKIKEAIKGTTSKSKDAVTKTYKFWTDGSKRVTMLMLLLVLVFCDILFWDNMIFGKNNLLKSNAFQVIMIVIGGIFTRDTGKGLMTVLMEGIKVLKKK